MPAAPQSKPDYGVDAPGVMRNLFFAGVVLFVLAFFVPPAVHLGPVTLLLGHSLMWMSVWFLLTGALFLLYVKVGKFRHRDFMLSLYPWQGSDNVLDVGCGRGLLLAGVAKRFAALHGGGHVTGIDVWSKEDMGGNSPEATGRNLELEGVTPYCTVLGMAAQDLSFPDGNFDVVVSNLCLHNIYDRPTREQALRQMVRVLAPGGTMLVSDYKLTGEYARLLRQAGLDVRMRWGSWVTTFPPLRVVIARKPA